MKVLFLDMDGVANAQADFDPKGELYIKSKGYPINPVLAERIRRIARTTGADIVLSSSWRLSAEGRAAVLEGVCGFIGVTPDNRGLTDRGCEVIDWLKTHEPIEQYAILDDNTDFHKEQHLFLTDWRTGITEEVAEAVIAHLGAV